MKHKAFLDFFAGSGLVTYGMYPYFEPVWSNDISEQKARVYKANNPPEHFTDCPIEEVRGGEIPTAILSWASFPCVDLSLAGKMEGINGKKSGLVWHWLRVLDEMKEKSAILVVENVLGLISANRGKHYAALHEALSERGYKVGPMVLNAIEWLPHSRPRVFIVAIKDYIDIDGLFGNYPEWNHPISLQKHVKGLKNLVWWKLPKPPQRKLRLSDIIQFDSLYLDEERSQKNIDMISPKHFDRLQEKINSGLRVAPGYKRIRYGRQVLELRFDDVAGCLRTPNGGSSRQYLVVYSGNKLKTRLLTIREAARLMGAPDDYKLPGSYNDGYAAMGDAVAVPVTKHLAKYLLSPLSERL